MTENKHYPKAGKAKTGREGMEHQCAQGLAWASLATGRILAFVSQKEGATGGVYNPGQGGVWFTPLF